MNCENEDELRRKLSCAEAELMRQTGCTADDVASIYNLPIPRPVVNVRMGQSHRLRLEAEHERDALRAQVAVLAGVAKEAHQELKKAGALGVIVPNHDCFHKRLMVAIAAAEGGEAND